MPLITKRLKNKAISWIRKQVRESGAKGIVVGLSGGIDSSVVAALAKEAVGKNNLLGLMLPCHSRLEDLKDAKLMAKILGIATKTIDLSATYDSFKKNLPKDNSLASANLKPRLRMAALYYLANKLNYLVCGTGNKSELMVGYFTKHGDGATDILPLAGLFKKDVRKLAEELHIPKPIILKPPTAGLWQGQTDEGEMGLTYTELDDILGRLASGRKQIAPRSKVNKVKAMIERSEHKRRLPGIFYP